MANRRCSFIKAGGERCKGTATRGATFCYAHNPARAQERQRNASKAGKAGGNGRPSGTSELVEAKGWVKGLISKMLRGEVERDVAGTAFMGINTLARLISIEHKLKETEELEERIEALEQMESGGAGGSRSWR